MELMLIVAMRGWLNDVRSYVPPVQIGEKMRGGSLATVIYSRMPNLKPGDIVVASVRFNWSIKLIDCRILDGVNMQLHLRSPKSFLPLVQHISTSSQS